MIQMNTLVGPLTNKEKITFPTIINVNVKFNRTVTMMIQSTVTSVEIRVLSKAQNKIQQSKFYRFTQYFTIANNKENFKHESVKEGIGSLKLSKKEIEQTIKALLVGLEGQTMDEGERQMEVAGDRAHMASMERM